jgi:hypothetical protein
VVDHTRLLVLGVGLPYPRALALPVDGARRPADRDGAPCQVDVAPAQRWQLAAPHAGVRQDVPGGVMRAGLLGPAQFGVDLLSEARTLRATEDN